MTTSVIQSLWIGNKLSTMEQLSMSSFLKNEHAYHLYTYRDVENVPDGVNVKDADEIIPENRIFKYKDYDSYAGFANLFRYKLLLENGGIWVDTDLVCLRPFDFSADYVFANVLSARPFRITRPFGHLRRRYHINNWFIKVKPGSDIMDYCYHESLKRNPEQLNWGDTGPRLLRSAVTKFNLQDYASPPEAFFPISARQWRQLINGSYFAKRKWIKAASSSYGIHLYNEMWRRNSIDKNGRHHSDSIYEQLKNRYVNAI